MQVPYFDPFGYVSLNGELMIYLQAYFDESGKPHDQDIASFCGFIATVDQWRNCWDAWERLRSDRGLSELKASEVLNHSRDLSATVSAQGVTARVKALAPFIHEIRKAVCFGIGVAVDCRAFRALPEQDRLTLKNPHYWAFQYAILIIQRCARERYPNETDIKFVLCCDEEESYAEACLKMFINLRMRFPEMRRTFVSFGIGDDKCFFQLQAADLIASLVRREADRKFYDAPFDMKPLYDLMLAKDDPLLAPVVVMPMDGALLSGAAQAERLRAAS
jgi:hypothetical protein